MERMQGRGVTFKLTARVTDAERGSVTLSSGEKIATETFIRTAGVTASPILQQLPVPHNDRGAAKGLTAMPKELVWPTEGQPKCSGLAHASKTACRSAS